MRERLLFLRDLILPPACGACGIIVASDRSFCLPCWHGLRWISDPRCDQCGEPFLKPYEAGPDGRCLACRLHPPPWRKARAPWVYKGAARDLILRFKSGYRPHLQWHMRGPLRHASAALRAENPLVIPVPLHRWRLWRRGYNQAALIAQGFARTHGLALLRDGLIRTRATAQSSGLTARQRARNVAGAFATPHPAQIRARGILLIDDVLTSGATASACTHALLRAGALYVDVLTLARVVRHPEASDIGARRGWAPQEESGGGAD